MAELFWEMNGEPITVTHDGTSFYFGDQFLAKSLPSAINKMAEIRRRVVKEPAPEPEIKSAEFVKMGDVLFDPVTKKHYEGITGDRIFLGYDRDLAFSELDELKKEMALSGKAGR